MVVDVLIHLLFFFLPRFFPPAVIGAGTNEEIQLTRRYHMQFLLLSKLSPTYSFLSKKVWFLPGPSLVDNTTRWPHRLLDLRVIYSYLV